MDIGAAYLPKNQDPTLGPNAVPGASAYTTNLLRAYRGYAAINDQQTRFWDEYHGLQFSMNRRMRNGLAFGTNYNLGLSLKGNTGLQLRLQHAADGTISVRSDQAQYEKLFENLALQRHVIKGFAVWDIPDVPSGWNSVAKAILNDWQLSGVLTAGSAYQPGALQANGAAQANPANNSNGRYDITYTYQNNGAAVNLTGSPDYNGRIVYVGDPGSGCSSDQYKQFNTDGGDRSAVRQRRTGIGPVHHGRLLRTHSRSRGRTERSSRRQPESPVPARHLQRVQHGDLQRP